MQVDIKLILSPNQRHYHHCHCCVVVQSRYQLCYNVGGTQRNYHWWVSHNTLFCLFSMYIAICIIFYYTVTHKNMKMYRSKTIYVWQFGVNCCHLICVIMWMCVRWRDYGGKLFPCLIIWFLNWLVWQVDFFLWSFRYVNRLAFFFVCFNVSGSFMYFGWRFKGKSNCQEIVSLTVERSVDITF